jgi:hypothetical protein
MIDATLRQFHIGNLSAGEADLPLFKLVFRPVCFGIFAIGVTSDAFVVVPDLLEEVRTIPFPVKHYAEAKQPGIGFEFFPCGLMGNFFEYSTHTDILSVVKKTGSRKKEFSCFPNFERFFLSIGYTLDIPFITLVHE